MQLSFWRSFLLGCLVTVLLMTVGYGGYQHYSKPKIVPISQVQGIKEGDPIFFTDWDYDTIQTQKVKQVTGLKKTFNVSMTVYTQELANKLGLIADHVTAELTPGMYSFEIRVKTTKNRTDCIFNALVDNNLPLDFPEQPVIAQLNGADLPIMKSALPDPVMRQFWKKRLNTYLYQNRNNYFATANYDPVHPVSPMMMFQPSPELIIKDFLPGIAWVSLTEFSCGSRLVRFLELPNPTLWMKKKAGRDYTKISGASHKEDFIHFTIPKSLIERILPIIKEAATS